MGSPAYKACPTFLSSLQATCQLSRYCTTLPSSGGFSLWFSFSIPSCLFPVQFFHSLPLFLLLLLSFTRFPIADEVILISQRQSLLRLSRHRCKNSLLCEHYARLSTYFLSLEVESTASRLLGRDV